MSEYETELSVIEKHAEKYEYKKTLDTIEGYWSKSYNHLSVDDLLTKQLTHNQGSEKTEKCIR